MEKALGNLTKDNLTGMARELGVPYSRLKKRELINEDWGISGRERRFAGRDEQGKTVAVIPGEILAQLGGESR